MNDKKRLEQLENAPEQPASIKDFGIVSIYKDDFEWLMKQAKTLSWVKEAITTCNEQDLTPKELARLIEK